MVHPAFLRDQQVYKDYLEAGKAGDLIFEGYEVDDSTIPKIKVIPGEAFCRIEGCLVNKVKRETRNLRLHIRESHHRETVDQRTGNISVAERMAALEWYRNLMEANASSSSAEDAAVEDSAEDATDSEPLPLVPLTNTLRVSAYRVLIC
ncbi:hypothetical protein V1506DRAFT_548601 [Lipomyces tetrasporus]